MDEPSVQVSLPVFPRSMRAASTLLGTLWLAEALLGRSGSTGGDPLGPFAWLALVPSRVAHGEVWRLLTHALLHDPQGFAPVLWTVLSLWFFGGPMEARWGTRKLFTAMVAATLAGALTVMLLGLLYVPFWAQRAYSPAAATAMLAGAWGMAQGTRPMSFLGLVKLTGRQFAALTAALLAVGFLVSRSPESVFSLVGLLLGAVLGNTRPAVPERSRRDSGPALRVIRGGASGSDLPN